MRVLPYTRLIMALRRELREESRAFLTPEEALAELKEDTNQDFGLDADKWQEWLMLNGFWP